MKNKQFKFIIKNVVAKNTHCYFISPHLDDAALSAGSLISYLTSKKVPVTVVNVFTKAHKNPSTFSVKAYLRQCGYRDAKDLFAQRRNEDKWLFKDIGVEVVNLGFVDAMWRKKEIKNYAVKLLGRYIPEVNHIYPTFRFHSFTGNISKYDEALKKSLETKLLKVTEGKESFVFCPVGIGHYIDHIIVRNVCSTIFKKPIYWSDFNYSMEFSREATFINEGKYKVAFFDKNLKAKKKLIQGYKSQTYAIFPHGKVPIFPDFYYL